VLDRRAALPGINGGYPHQKGRNRTGKSYLIPDLQYSPHWGVRFISVLTTTKNIPRLSQSHRELGIYSRNQAVLRESAYQDQRRALMISSCLVGLKHFMMFLPGSTTAVNWQARSFTAYPPICAAGKPRYLARFYSR